MGWYLKVIKQYADFKGRARRKEYWFFTLFHLLIGVTFILFNTVIIQATNNPDFAIGFVLYGIYMLSVLLPAIAVTVRRLHDTDHSAWWILISLVPLVGSIILLVFLCQDGNASVNRFGENPKPRKRLAVA